MKTCPKCKKEFEDKNRFCDGCGTKLKEKILETAHKIEKISPLIIPWIVFGVLIILTSTLLLPTKVVSYQIEVPSIETEQYSVDVPYETVEPYTVQVPYEVKEQYVESIPTQEEIKYTYSWDECSTSSWLTTGKSSVKITNLDSETFTFSVKIGYNDNSGQFISTTMSKTILPASYAVFTYSPTPSSFKNCGWQWVTTPTKTTYKDVIKERTVTKYREETQYKTVTKTRTETREREVRKTKMETKQKEVSWLFGFDAIIKFKNLS